MGKAILKPGLEQVLFFYFFEIYVATFHLYWHNIQMGYPSIIMFFWKFKRNYPKLSLNTLFYPDLLYMLYFQYPGVAKSIDSDINNLMSVLKFWDILPKGEILK